MIGSKAKFNYPAEFVTLPDYTAHAGQVVEVLSKYQDAVYDEAGGLDEEAMYKVRAQDGWEGDAFESELEVKQ
jgi:hypothetical protein